MFPNHFEVGILIPTKNLAIPHKRDRKEDPLDIAKTSYYDDLIRSLTDDMLKDNIKFNKSGFSYMSKSLALVMSRESKNNYVICSIYGGSYHWDRYPSCAKAVDLAKRAIALDLEGYMN